MAVYKAAKGAMYDDKTAQLIGALVESSPDMTPLDFVNAARPVSSPLHSLFDWDDDAAAEKYRVWQARQHISHLHIIVRMDGKDSSTRAAHSVVVQLDDDTSARRYVSSVKIATDADLRKQVIAKALSDLREFRRRYQEYQDVFSGVFRAIEKLTAKKPRKRRIA